MGHAAMYARLLLFATPFPISLSPEPRSGRERIPAAGHAGRSAASADGVHCRRAAPDAASRDSVVRAELWRAPRVQFRCRQDAARRTALLADDAAARSVSHLRLLLREPRQRMGL